MPRAPSRALPRRTGEAPFAAAAAALALAGAGGMLAQAALTAPLVAALGSPVPAAVGSVLALMLGVALGAGVARASRLRSMLGARAPGLAPPLVGPLAGAPRVLPPARAALAGAPLGLRAVVGGGLLLLPSLGTGLIFPALAPAAAREASGSRRVTLLFASGLAGGAVGAALATWRYGPAQGLSAALPAGAIATVLASAAALFVAWRWPTARAPGAARAADARPQRGPSPLAMASTAHGFLGGGALALVAHVVHVATGDAPDAVPAVLAGTLVGLAAGAVRARTLLLHYRETALVRAMAAASLVLAAATVLMGPLPAAAQSLGGFLRAPSDAAALHVLVAIAAAALPAAWVGASFQLLLPHVREDLVLKDGVGRSAGAGAAGAALGAAFAGVVLLPRIGAQRGLLGLALGFAALALAIAWRGRARRSVAVTALAAAAIAALSPRWDLARAALGPQASGPSTWAREGVGLGVVATTASAVGVNGRAQRLTADDETMARLAAALAPRLGVAVAPDDLGLAAALFAAPWSAVTVPRVPPSWYAHLPPALRLAAEEPRADPAPGYVLATLPRGRADALLLTAPPACGDGCARAFAQAAAETLAPGGLAIFVVRDPEPYALEALLRAALATFPHAGLAVVRSRAAVLGGLGPLEPPAGRGDALAAAATPIDVSQALAALIATGPSELAACIGALVRRRDASPSTLRTCAGARATRALN